MSMREEVLKLVKESGGWVGVLGAAELHSLPQMERFYKAAYLAGAKAMQEEAAKVCDESGSHMCADAIRAINPENLLAVE